MSQRGTFQERKCNIAARAFDYIGCQHSSKETSETLTNYNQYEMIPTCYLSNADDSKIVCIMLQSLSFIDILNDRI